MTPRNIWWIYSSTPIVQWLKGHYLPHTPNTLGRNAWQPWDRISVVPSEWDLFTVRGVGIRGELRLCVMGYKICSYSLQKFKLLLGPGFRPSNKALKSHYSVTFLNVTFFHADFSLPCLGFYLRSFFIKRLWTKARTNTYSLSVSSPKPYLNFLLYYEQTCH